MSAPSSLEPLADFVARSKGVPLDEFKRLHPHPFLIIEVSEEETGKPTAATTRVKTPSEAARSQALAPVRKIEGRHGFTFVSIGRASHNDVVVAGPTISKVHAFLIPPKDAQGRWRIMDAGSTNGTRVNGVPLAAGVERDLHEADEFVLGESLRATFFEAEGLHRYLGLIA